MLNGLNYLNLPQYNHECNEKFVAKKITVISIRKFYYINWNKRSKQTKSVY